MILGRGDFDRGDFGGVIVSGVISSMNHLRRLKIEYLRVKIEKISYLPQNKLKSCIL